MFKHYFERIENIEIWPVISLIIFFTFFVGLFFWVYKVVDNSYYNKMSDLPLEGDEALAGTQKNESHG
jgi:cytochrome c oxidase cbb3-type subunit IV